MGTNITCLDLNNQNIKERGKGTPLANATRQRKKPGKIAINIKLKKIDLVAKIRAKTHSRKSKAKERPVNPVKCLLLIKGEDNTGVASQRTKIDNITQKRYILSNEAAWHTTGLITPNHQMDDLEEVCGYSTLGNLIINIKKTYRPPIPGIKAITLPIRKGDDATLLQTRQQARMKG